MKLFIITTRFETLKHFEAEEIYFLSDEKSSLDGKKVGERKR
jgi:hypothetical protein